MQIHSDTPRRVHYRVKPGSPAADALAALDAQEKAYIDAVVALFKALRLPKTLNPVGWNGHCVGFSSNPMQKAIDYVHAHSDLWRWEPKQRHAVPRRTNAEGKALAEKFEALPRGVQEQDPTQAFTGAAGLVLDGNWRVTCTIYRHREEAIIGIPWVLANPKLAQKACILAADKPRVKLVDGLVEMLASESFAFIDQARTSDDE